MSVSRSPLVIAHRGSSHAVAEHTLAAYAQAIEEGADALECDVRLTRDGHLVCVHDRRIDRTSNGRGPVSEFELADLYGLDFASWHGTRAVGYPGEPPEPPPPTAVLTLEELLGVVVDAPRPVRMLVETKHPTRYAGLVEQQLVRTLRRFGLDNQPDRDAATVTVMSFAPIGIRRIRLLAPSLPTVLLMDRVPPIRRDGSLPAGVGIAGPGIRVIRAHPGYVARAHARGHRVYVWTVDEPDDVELVLALGVDAVITNRPVQVLRRLGRR
ncbi:MAG TPA: glycerophosphodiester phosphodiesterase family protein [Mycobacteriales bacterium]|nr:glycerophosphodiester phosphodiesterase family protein [Mycobacteriales bacterium]